MKWDNIPQELKNNGLWCVWRLTNGKKLPFNPTTNTMAKSNDRTSFAPYSIALNAVTNYYFEDEDGRLMGGLGLGIFNGYSAVDIDNCVVKGVPNEFAQEIIDFIGSYTELSPSGKGVRILFKTKTSLNKETHYINNRKHGLEIYLSDQTNKFVTVTGNVILASDIIECDISYILEKYMKKDTTTAISNIPRLETNDKLINAIKYDKKLNELWHSIASGSGGNESETDLALCNKLSYYLEGDYNAINDAFVDSPYFKSKDEEHKRKWLVRNDYREMTIKQSIKSYNENKVAKNNINYELTDTGNAHRFWTAYNGMIKYNVDNKLWMFYNGKYWQYDVNRHIKNLAEIVIENLKQEARLIDDNKERKRFDENIKRMLSSVGKEAMLKEAQHLEGIPVTNDTFNKDDYLINTKSGIVDLRDGSIKPHDKSHMMSNYIPYEVSYKEPKLWNKFLNEVQPNKPAVVSYLKKALGYGLSNLTREQCMFILIGDGSNGKSLMLDVIHSITTGYSASSNVNILMENKNNQSNLGDIAKLNGVRMVITEEPEAGQKLAESKVKQLTSGLGNIVARFLYGNEFEFTFTGKIFMSANHKPIIRGTDNGIWRRMRVIPFDRVFKEHEQDKDLRNKLMKEAPQILGWLIQGFQEYQKEDLISPKEITTQIADYRSEMDLVQRWINENCEVDTGYYETSIELFKNLTQYIIDNKEFQMSNTLFGRNMSKKFEKARIGGSTVYKGIRIRKMSLGEGLARTSIKEDDI